jgi:hypothetical protein
MDIIHILKWVVKTFEDTKGLIRILNRKKDILYNGHRNKQ